MSNSTYPSTPRIMSMERVQPEVTASTDRRYSTVVTEFKRRKGLLSSRSKTTGDLRTSDILSETADSGGPCGKSYVSWEPVDDSLAVQDPGRSPLETRSPDFGKPDLASPETPDLSSPLRRLLLLPLAQNPTPSGQTPPESGTMDPALQRKDLVHDSSTPLPTIVVTEVGGSPKTPLVDLEGVEVGPQKLERRENQQSTGSRQSTSQQESSVGSDSVTLINYPTTVDSWPESSFPQQTPRSRPQEEPYPVFSEPVKDVLEWKGMSSHNRTYTVVNPRETDPLFHKLEFEPSSGSGRTSYFTATEVTSPLMYPPGDSSSRSYNLVSARNSLVQGERSCSGSRPSHRPSVGSYSIIEVNPMVPMNLEEEGLGVKLEKQRRNRRIGWFLIGLGSFILVADAIAVVVMSSMNPPTV
ncbi:uncharacterized protein LOC143038191 [Oratosquilla oratoria]|uniref:uncharacterized protein LOC143038191 n=1 Tax=Oratosquilla oratoria TaxID=337810 RepID=UPI003F77063B